MAVLREKFEEDWNALPKLLQGWFYHASKRDDPKPSFEACVTLAYDFMPIFNRHNNSEWESRSEHVPLRMFKDLSWDELKAKKVNKFMAAVNQLSIAAEELEISLGGYTWEDGEGTIQLADIQNILGRIGGPVASAKPLKAKNRPNEEWHIVAKQIAPLVETALREAGQHTNLSPKKETSVTASVGAELISWAFTRAVTAGAFAKAMQNRNRTKPSQLTFEKRFPEITRIKIAT